MVSIAIGSDVIGVHPVRVVVFHFGGLIALGIRGLRFVFGVCEQTAGVAETGSGVLRRSLGFELISVG